MVDFKKLHNDWYARLTDEERTRVDQFTERENQSNKTAVQLTATFERLEWKREAPRLPAVQRRPGMMFRPQQMSAPRERSAPPQAEVAESWEQEVTVSIVVGTEPGGRAHELLRFVGGPTGHEIYTLDEDFCALIAAAYAEDPSGRFTLCAGTPGRWHACSVDLEEVEIYLRTWRPNLFPSPAPGMNR